MNRETFLKDSQIIILGVCVAVATVFSSIILSNGIIKMIRLKNEVITVTGSAQKNIVSDNIVWRGVFYRRDADIAAAYKKIVDDLREVKSYLIEKGVTGKEMVISQVTTTPIYKKSEYYGNDTTEIKGYCLSQSVDVISSDVNMVTAISREATELMNKGIEFESQPPNYYYTKLDDLKVEMLALASENAKLRAVQMAKATGNKIGVMRSARMGVFQITPVNSTEVSDYGVNDTSTRDKKVTAVVTAGFELK